MEQLPRILKQWNDGSYILRLIKLNKAQSHDPDYRLERMLTDTMGQPNWQTRDMSSFQTSIIKALTNDL